MSDKTRADEGSSTNDNELSLDELKDVSGGGLGSVNNEVGGWVRKGDEAKTTTSPWDADKCQDQMAQAKCARKIQNTGQAWKNDKNV